MTVGRIAALVIVLVTVSCDGPVWDADELAAMGEGGTAFLRKPFQGQPPCTWGFDHDLPVNALSEQRFHRGTPGLLDWRGQNVELSWGDGNGHNGYDWFVPTGTEILAAADGTVELAGLGTPVQCGQETKTAIVVRLVHVGPRGRPYATLYVHLDSVAVEPGQTVRAGDVLGRAGASGCASGPHLHFSVYDLSGDTRVPVDPFGWAGDGADPWVLEPDGAASEWLWRGDPPDGDGRS